MIFLSYQLSVYSKLIPWATLLTYYLALYMRSFRDLRLLKAVQLFGRFTIINLLIRVSIIIWVGRIGGIQEFPNRFHSFIFMMRRGMTRCTFLKSFGYVDKLLYLWYLIAITSIRLFHICRFHKIVLYYYGGIVIINTAITTGYCLLIYKIDLFLGHCAVFYVKIVFIQMV